VPREFDESFLQRIAEIFFEDEVVNLPHPPDVSSYLMSEVLDWNRCDS
jgi:RNA polymerase II C-terminal domain phosphatase-like 1/2